MQTFQIIATAVTPLLVALIGGLFALESRRRKAHEKTLDETSAKRADEYLKAMKVMSGNFNLTLANTQAIRHEYVNGWKDAVDEAEVTAKNAMADYFNFIDVNAVKHM